MVTDEEVNARQAEIAKLRQDAIDAEAEADRAQREHANDLQMAALAAEEAALTARIEQAKAKGDPDVLKADLDRRAALIGPEDVEAKFGKNVEVQRQDDGTVIVLSVKGGEDAPEPPPAVTDATPTPPTPPPTDLEVKPRKSTAKD